MPPFDHHPLEQSSAATHTYRHIHCDSAAPALNVPVSVPANPPPPAAWHTSSLPSAGADGRTVTGAVHLPFHWQRYNRDTQPCKSGQLTSSSSSNAPPAVCCSGNLPGSDPSFSDEESQANREPPPLTVQLPVRQYVPTPTFRPTRALGSACCVRFPLGVPRCLCPPPLPLSLSLPGRRPCSRGACTAGGGWELYRREAGGGECRGEPRGKTLELFSTEEWAIFPSF